MAMRFDCKVIFVMFIMFLLLQACGTVGDVKPKTVNLLNIIDSSYTLHIVQNRYGKNHEKLLFDYGEIEKIEASASMAGWNINQATFAFPEEIRSEYIPGNVVAPAIVLIVSDEKMESLIWDNITLIKVECNIQRKTYGYGNDTDYCYAEIFGRLRGAAKEVKALAETRRHENKPQVQQSTAEDHEDKPRKKQSVAKAAPAPTQSTQPTIQPQPTIIILERSVPKTDLNARKVSPKPKPLQPNNKESCSKNKE